MRRLEPVAALAAVGVAMLAVAACAVKPTRSLEDACTHAAQAFLGREACFQVTPAANASELVSRQAEWCVLYTEAPGSRLTAEYWDRCASAANNGCRAYQCDYYPLGARQVGEPCLGADQCATLFCRGIDVPGEDMTALPSAVRCGVCAPRLAVGTPCDVNLDGCELGASCFQGTCRAKAGEGTACASWDDCALPVVCGSSGVCRLPAFAGQPCTTGRDCASYTGCDAITKLCTPGVYGLGGDPCDGDARVCRVGACNITPGASTGTCPDLLSDGAPCDPADRSHVCRAYAACFNGVCQIPDPATCG